MSGPSSSLRSAAPPKASPWAAIAQAGTQREAQRLEALRIEAQRAAIEVQRKAKSRCPASSVHRHAIESILVFLSLSELTKAIRVCHLWLSAVQHMRPIGARVSFITVPRRSVLLRHVSNLKSEWWRAERSADATFLDAAVAAMPHLHTLSCLVTLPRTPVAWPSKLTDLTLHSAAETNAAGGQFRVPVADAKAFLQSFRAPLLRRLTLNLQVTELGTLDLSFLTQMYLKELYLNLQWTARGNYQLTDQQVDIIRQLALLTTLRCARMHSTCLRRVLQPPHRWILKHAPTFFALDQAAADCLGSLPTLTALDARLCSSASFLSNLPLLATLQFDCHRLAIRGGGWLLIADDVVQGLSSCKALTDLTLTAPLGSSQMFALLSRLPSLHTLVLDRMRELESLRCFAGGPAASRLTSLTLIQCQHFVLHLGNLTYLHSLRNLRKLVLANSFTHPLTNADIERYTPPSPFFPRLTFFDTHREPVTPIESEDEQEQRDQADQ